MSSKERAALRQLRALADRSTPLVQRQVQQALASLRDAVSLDALARAIAARDAFALHDLVGTLPKRLQPALRTLQHALMDSAQFTAATLQAGPARLGLRFAEPRPFAAQAARALAARLVTQVTYETRLAIRTVVSRSFVEGITPRAAAQLIKPLIGLTSRQALAVRRAHASLLADGISRAAARARSEAYAARLLRQRSLLIARTEIIQASTAGQLAAWQEAQFGGVLSLRARKVWLVTADDRLCPFCRTMDGQTAPINAEFSNRFGLGKVQGPPLHPACRCAIGMTFTPARRAA